MEIAPRALERTSPRMTTTVSPLRSKSVMTSGPTLHSNQCDTLEDETSTEGFRHVPPFAPFDDSRSLHVDERELSPKLTSLIDLSSVEAGPCNTRIRLPSSKWGSINIPGTIAFHPTRNTHLFQNPGPEIPPVSFRSPNLLPLPYSTTLSHPTPVVDNPRGDMSEHHPSESRSDSSVPSSPLTSEAQSRDWADLGPLTLFQEENSSDMITAELLQMCTDIPIQDQRQNLAGSTNSSNREEIFEKIRNKRWIRDTVGCVGRSLGLSFGNRPEDYTELFHFIENRGRPLSD